jgi:hypothetical protein
MSCLLYVTDEESKSKINIDDLYERKQRQDLKQISIFDKILNRIHKRIQFTGRNKSAEKHIWFTIPSYIFGEPCYDQGECIAYIYTKLEENGFFLRYLHPNTLFISWKEWVPTYVRTELKRKMGIVIDERGKVVQSKSDAAAEAAASEDSNDPNSRIFNDRTGSATQKEGKQYTPIGSYKPTGVYNKEMFEKIERKVSFK